MHEKKSSHIYITHVLPIIFCVFAALRSAEFIYIEILVSIIGLVFVKSKISAVAPSVISIYANFFAPMDNDFRFGGLYPSLHTFDFGGFKGVDVLVVCLVIYALKMSSLMSLKKIIIENWLVVVLSPFLLISSLFSIGLTGLTYEYSAILYVLRGLLLYFSLTIIFLRFKKEELVVIAKAAINTCIYLMIAATLSPTANALTRELIGINLKVSFAGDEFNSIGVLIASILLIKKVTPLGWYYFYMAVSLILALASGRKSAIGYFFFCWLMVFFTNRYKSIFKPVIVNSILLLEHISPFLVLIIVEYLNIPVLNLAFFESLGILEPTLNSVKTLFISNPLFNLFGIGPFTKYPLVGLDPMFDHSFSFGPDAGLLHKLKVWFFPLDRMVLSFGLVGIVACGIFIVNSLKKAPAESYIKYYLLYLLSFNLTSTILITSLSIGMAAIIIHRDVNSCFPARP